MIYVLTYDLHFTVDFTSVCVYFKLYKKLIYTAENLVIFWMIKFNNIVYLNKCNKIKLLLDFVSDVNFT